MKEDRRNDRDTPVEETGREVTKVTEEDERYIQR